MKLSVVSGEGKELRTLDVDESVFGIIPNQAVLHQAFVRQRANQRAGTAMTKTRGEVQGSTRKIRPQKGSGRARAGGARSPTRVGGGTVFGPRPRDYSQDMPKKMRRLAIRSALSGKLADGQLIVIDDLSMDKPKTNEIVRILGNVGLHRSALVITSETNRTVLASVRNLHRIESLPAAYLNVGDMMNHAGILMTEQAVRVAEGLWGKKERVEKAATPAPAKASKKATAPPKASEKPMASTAEIKSGPETIVEPPAQPQAPTARKRASASKAKSATPAPVAEKPKRASAPKVKATITDTAVTEKSKRAAKPKAEAKPKTAAKKKTEATEKPAAEKPKRRTTKKTEGTE